VAPLLGEDDAQDLELPVFDAAQPLERDPL
jgi:hypothetical protein